MFYTVFSTNVSPKMQWQSDLLEFTWKRVGQAGELIRLVATDDPQNLPQQKYARCVPTTLWDVDPESGDSWPIYNKPASLLEWLYRDRPEGTVLLLDPDCVFRAPVKRRVAPGFPAAQDWIDFCIAEPGPESPFGLGATFSALTECCKNTSLSIPPVMIPKLIHTRDLRRIAARWLELCRQIRRHCRNAEGAPFWESDMFAYLAVCAEYGLRHEPMSLGICNNWDPAKVLDAPIIHYCQSIYDTQGKTVFNKHTYRAWTRIDAVVALDRDRDLIQIINDYVDGLEGIYTVPAAAESWPARRNNIKEARLLDNLMLERTSDGTRIWLNHTGKVLWDYCDGQLTVEEIAGQLHERFAADEGTIMPQIRSLIGKLHAIDFICLEP